MAWAFFDAASSGMGGWQVVQTQGQQVLKEVARVKWWRGSGKAFPGPGRIGASDAKGPGAGGSCQGSRCEGDETGGSQDELLSRLWGLRLFLPNVLGSR